MGQHTLARPRAPIVHLDDPRRTVTWSPGRHAITFTLDADGAVTPDMPPRPADGRTHLAIDDASERTNLSRRELLEIWLATWGDTTPTFLRDCGFRKGVRHAAQ